MKCSFEFRAQFGWHSSLCIFKVEASRSPKAVLRKAFRDFRETGPWTLAGFVLDSPCLQITHCARVFQWVRSTGVPLLSTYRCANTRASGFAFGSGRSLWSLRYCPWFALITRGSCWPSSPRWSRGTGIALDKRCCTWDPGFTLFSLLATEILSLSWEWKAKDILSHNSTEI